MGADWSVAALLPGACLAACALLLVLSCRRWLDPIPWWVVAVWSIPFAVLLGPVLVGGEVLLPLGNLTHDAPYRTLAPPDPPSHGLQGDLVREIQPWQVQVRRSLRAGRWPLWNAQAGAGMGLLADPQSQALQPLALVTLLVRDLAAPGLLAGFRMLAALAGMFLLLRRQGLGLPAALLGSLAHGVGAPLLMWLGYPLANALALLPWPLCSAVRCDSDGRRRDWVLFASTVAALLLAGHPEVVLLAVVVVGAFLAAAAWRRRGSVAALLPFLARVGASLALAGALAAPALLPGRVLLAQSDRAAVLGAFLTERPWSLTLSSLGDGLTDPNALARWGTRLRRRAAALVSARSRGDFGSHWGEGNFIVDTANFSAGPVLLLVAAVLAPARRRRAGERLMHAVVLSSLLVAAQPNGLTPLAARIGLFGGGVVTAHHRVLLLAVFAFAYLAACEADRWASGERRARPLLLAALAVGLAIAWTYSAFPREGEGNPVFWLEAQWRRLELAMLAAAAIALLAAAGRTASDRVRRGAVFACALVAGAELVLVLRDATRPAPARLYYPVVEPVSFLRRGLGDARFVGVGATLPPNFGQLHGLADLRIHGPSRPAIYDQLLGPLWSDPTHGLGTYFMLERFRHPLHDLLGTRYVVAPRRRALSLRLVLRHRAAWIYERPSWLPRLFLPREAVAVPPERLLARLASNRDFAARSLLLAAGEGEDPALRWRARARRIELDRLALLEPERVAASVALAERRLLASSIFQDGGWRLLENGAPRALRLANGPFVAAWLEAGEQRLELLYRPPGFLLGTILAACGLAALACVAPTPPRR